MAIPKRKIKFNWPSVNLCFNKKPKLHPKRGSKLFPFIYNVSQKFNIEIIDSDNSHDGNIRFDDWFNGRTIEKKDNIGLPFLNLSLSGSKAISSNKVKALSEYDAFYNEYGKVRKSKEPIVSNKIEFERSKFKAMLDECIIASREKKGPLFENLIENLFISHNPYFRQVYKNFRISKSNQVDLMVIQGPDLGIHELGDRWIIECKNKPQDAINITEVGKLGEILISNPYKTGIIVSTCKRITREADQKISDLHLGRVYDGKRINIIYFLISDLKDLYKGASLIDKIIEKYAKLGTNIKN